MGRLFGLLAGVLAGWFGFRFLRRRRAAAARADGDPASELRDKLSQARETEESERAAEESAGEESGTRESEAEEPVAASGGEPADNAPENGAPENGAPSLEDERQRVHERARKAVERMRPDGQSG